jgi:5-methyltetrahydrofolate--homocysteine methyltransferase
LEILIKVKITISNCDLQNKKLCQAFTKPLQNLIFILGGTMLQRYNFSEEDFRENVSRFSAKKNNDLLVAHQPQAIKDVHAAYFEAGADIVETNTFSGTTIGMADYHLEDMYRIEL